MWPLKSPTHTNACNIQQQCLQHWSCCCERDNMTHFMHMRIWQQDVRAFVLSDCARAHERASSVCTQAYMQMTYA
jgi:hypothetical protein